MPKSEKTEPAFAAHLIGADDSNALDAVKAAGGRAEALIQAWTAAQNAIAVAAVAERGQGAARKAARRALNVLSARGVTLPVAQRVARLAPAAIEEVIEAWMMAPDSTGMQLFAITSRAPTGRHRATFVFLHGAAGVARVDNATLSHSQLKEHFAKLLPGAGYGTTRVPVEWARTRVAAARALHKASGVPEPLGMMTAQSLLEPVPTEPAPHPFDEEGLELGEEDALETAKQSGQLHNLPEFRSWLPSQAAMQEILMNVGQKLTPGETPEPGVVTEHLQAEVLSATDRYFTPDLREELVRRMKDSAICILAREGEQKALEVAAVIATVSKCGLVTHPPREVPFLRAFFDKAVALMIAQGSGRLRIPVQGGLGAAVPTPADATPTG
jgi:hypothetical protein